MASYKVVADNIVGKSPGDTITDEELDGCNIEALIEGGHITADPSTKTKAEKE